MNRKPVPEQTPADPLRAKYVRHGKTVIIITEATPEEIRRLLDIFRDSQHPPHLSQ